MSEGMDDNNRSRMDKGKSTRNVPEARKSVASYKPYYQKRGDD
jgi:hypothetical protein